MPQVKTVKLIFYFTALILAAKPFVGFEVFGHLNTTVQTNIFAKVFNKRVKEDSRLDFDGIREKLAEAGTGFSLRFSFLLSILFPFIFKSFKDITSRALRQIQIGLLPLQLNPLNGQLLI
jgi:hypothetical protein